LPLDTGKLLPRHPPPRQPAPALQGGIIIINDAPPLSQQP
jgi:hypothetical protein